MIYKKKVILSEREKKRNSFDEEFGDGESGI